MSQSTGIWTLTWTQGPYELLTLHYSPTVVGSDNSHTELQETVTRSSQSRPSDKVLQYLNMTHLLI